MKKMENSVQCIFETKCSFGCDDSRSDLVSQCIKKWRFLDNECIPTRQYFIQFSTSIRMNQVYGLKVDLMNHFTIKINELDLIIMEIGQKQLIADDIISSIIIQIQVQCLEKSQYQASQKL
ncbi:unnamed protein product [Paramecium primaurelia]|uniref:Uncharacterized protein n=1 Tax=Paramecium primaurelia TaxID=5886 RepID=A0A8S1PBB8_PARPR|nr:unnamed protein product [Paramecium primaurelia]